MAKRNHKHEKRVKKLIVVCLLSAIILTVSTYAWFIGMQTVSVNAFEVKIAAAEGLALSVDGVTFSDTVTINGSAENQQLIKTNYASNTNKWSDLEPISTVGEMNNTTNGSRMIIYEKSSLTASGGGYRLLSEQLVNKDDPDTTDKVEEEANGYVVFDLFIKNLSGRAYYEEMNKGNEEAIYLTTESSVSVSTSGVENTGIENSVRVAFAQVGRVKSDAAKEAIQGIDCAATVDGVTGICRNASIWEPNDTKHVANAISWYNSSCTKRTGKTTFDKDTECSTVEANQFYQTYAVNKVITEDKNDANRDYEVDVYDGYNLWNQSIDDGYLNGIDTVTDSEKILTGSSRPEFMTLAPNSITKVRVYVYIEGQDIDNYDFASLGKAVNVNFGFTKERFYAEDFGYDNDPDAYKETIGTIDGEDLYRNYRVAFDAQGAEVTGLPQTPEKVQYVTIGATNYLLIPRTIKDSFEFKAGEATKVATPSESGDGTTDWTITDKQ